MFPRDSRDVYTFLYLNPNITQGSGGRRLQVPGGAKLRRQTSPWTGSGRTVEFSARQPTASHRLEAVGDINVLSNDFSAEYAGYREHPCYHQAWQGWLPRVDFYNNKNSAYAATTLAGHPRQGRVRSNPCQSTVSQPLLQLQRRRRLIWWSNPEVEEDLVFRGVRKKLGTAAVQS